MDISFFCEKCGQHVVIDAVAAGQLVDCPKCGTPLAVPYKSKPLNKPATFDTTALPTPASPSAPSPVQATSSRSVSNRPRILVVLALVIIFSVAVIFAARKLFAPPTLDGEAFLVMKSLDVKKLADLKVYLLHDPYPAIAEVKKAITDQYEQIQKNVAQSDPTARNLVSRVASLKAELISLDAEKQKELEKTNKNINETLRQVAADVTNLKSQKAGLENQIDVLSQQIEPTQKELKTLKGSRSDIEARYAPGIQQAEAESNYAQRALQDYVDRALTAAAKLINDHILARNLTVDLVPKDGRFKEEYSFADSYKSEIFEAKKEHGFSLKDMPGWLGVRVKADEDAELSEYAIFTKFPTSLTDQNLRQTFITYYQAYAKQRSALEAARDAAAKRLTATTEQRRLTLQKFEFQNGARMETLETQVQKSESQLGLLKTKLDSMTVEINGKEAVLSKPPAEQVASLRAEIERVFAERRATIERQVSSNESELKPLIAEAMSRQWSRIMDSAEDKMAAAIATKIAASATTDSEGKFVIRSPTGGQFVVYAETKTGGEEHIFWFEKVKVAGSGKTAIKLSNSNAQRAPNLAGLVFGDFSQPK